MKCPSCKKQITSGVLFFRPGAKFEARGLNPETCLFESITRKEIVRIVAFCSNVCKTEFFLHRDRFNKFEIPLQRRLISREEVIVEFQKILLSDKKEQKDLVYILGQSVWR